VEIYDQLSPYCVFTSLSGTGVVHAEAILKAESTTSAAVDRCRTFVFIFLPSKIVIVVVRSITTHDSFKWDVGIYEAFSSLQQSPNQTKTSISYLLSMSS